MVGGEPARLIFRKIFNAMKNNPKTESIAVIGMGYVGCPLAAVMASRGWRVVGIDANRALIDTLRSGRPAIEEPGLTELVREVSGSGALTFSNDLSGISDCDVIVVTVGTPIDEAGHADLGTIKKVCAEMAPLVRDEQLVILKSTVPPGTTQELVAPVLGGRAALDIAFCPERLAEGEALRDIRTLPVVIGGITPQATERAAEFIESALGVETVRVSNPAAAELTKLADNLWIDLNIALGNELAKVADTLSLDVLEIVAAANSLKKGQHHVNILTPSLGVGGSCLTKDPWFLHQVARDQGVEIMLPAASRTINDNMPAYSVRRIAEALDASRPGIPRERCKIAVLGIAFKNNTSDCRNSPTKPAIAALIEEGFNVVIHDPLVADEDARMVTGLPLELNREKALADADCVAFFAGHDAFCDISPEYLAGLLTPGSVVFDGRIFFDRTFIDGLTGRGLIYVGVGRN